MLRYNMCPQRLIEAVAVVAIVVGDVRMSIVARHCCLGWSSAALLLLLLGEMMVIVSQTMTHLMGDS